MKRLTFLSGMVFLIISCNSEPKEASLTTSQSNSNSAESNFNAYDCLEKFNYDYSQLLTKEEMNAVYPIDFENSKVNLRSGSYGEHIYMLTNDRGTFTQEISGMKMEIPDDNSMGVKMLEFKSESSDLQSIVDFFDMGYKQLSDGEKSKIQSNLEEADADIKETGKDLMKIRENTKYEFVDGLGSSAWFKWDERYGGERRDEREHEQSVVDVGGVPLPFQVVVNSV